MAEGETCDVIVIGGGSAAFEAAVSAGQSGAEKVVMLEKAPEAEYGGNARFSHTGFRFCHTGRDEIRAFIPDAEVLNTSNQPIRGLYASGDIIGLFYHNYPSCNGKIRNLVFSRKAGINAAALKI